MQTHNKLVGYDRPDVCSEERKKTKIPDYLHVKLSSEGIFQEKDEHIWPLESTHELIYFEVKKAILGTVRRK